MLKFLWPLLKVYLRIPSSIWRAIAYLFQTKHNYHPTWTHATSYELDFMPHASDLFLSPNRQLGGKKYVLYFSLFTTWFLALQIPFREKLIPSPMRKRLPDINAFPANLNWRQDSKVFPGRLLNPDWSIQISRASRMKGGFLVILFGPLRSHKTQNISNENKIIQEKFILRLTFYPGIALTGSGPSILALI